MNMHISPLIILENPGSDNRRTIVDLSWPHGFSVDGYLRISTLIHIIICLILWII